jgi:hypothetical protein
MPPLPALLMSADTHRCFSLALVQDPSYANRLFMDFALHTVEPVLKRVPTKRHSLLRIMYAFAAPTPTGRMQVCGGKQLPTRSMGPCAMPPCRRMAAMGLTEACSGMVAMLCAQRVPSPPPPPTPSPLLVFCGGLLPVAEHPHAAAVHGQD